MGNSFPVFAIRKMLTSAHLFAGGGGDTEGAIAAGYTPLWAIESDKHAAAVYRKRFPNTQLIEADIKTLSIEFIRQLPVPNILIWGSPCPDFSIAGKRAGIMGDRGQLFFEGIRFLGIVQPKLFLFENVQGLLSSNGGEDAKEVIRQFTKVGYVGSWQCRNGNRHVPQNRARVFFVGVHGECAGDISNPRQKNAG